jgi:hypothetical protein
MKALATTERLAHRGIDRARTARTSSWSPSPPISTRHPRCQILVLDLAAAPPVDAFALAAAVQFGLAESCLGAAPSPHRPELAGFALVRWGGY